MDLLRRWAVARDFYTNDGVLPNHFSLFRPRGRDVFSLYHAFSTLPDSIDVSMLTSAAAKSKQMSERLTIAVPRGTLFGGTLDRLGRLLVVLGGHGRPDGPRHAAVTLAVSALFGTFLVTAALELR